jgi:hypothetical protein
MREDLRAAADTRVEVLRDDGFEQAGVYDPPGVGGTNVIYVLARADQPERYGLPRDPRIPLSVRLWKGPLKWLGSAVLLGGILGAFFHYLRFGPKGERNAER